jgi:hypothetical protein
MIYQLIVSTCGSVALYTNKMNYIMVSTIFLTMTCHRRCSVGVICGKLFIAKEGHNQSEKVETDMSIVCLDYEECCLGGRSCTLYRSVRVPVRISAVLVPTLLTIRTIQTHHPRGNSSEQKNLRTANINVSKSKRRLKVQGSSRTKDKELSHPSI